MQEFSQAAVIGTGMMGPGIALTLALGGVRATILSRTQEGARRGLESAIAQGRLLEEHGLIEGAHAAAARGRLGAGTDFDGTVAAADLVIESAPENMDFKKSLFARLDAVARPDAVLASNTSGLSITEIASACRRPERVITTHFWNPPHLMPLVEIVRGDRTAPEIAAAVRGLLERCGKTPVIVKKDRRGQLGNRLQMALVREAAYMIAEGHCGGRGHRRRHPRHLRHAFSRLRAARAHGRGGVRDRLCGGGLRIRRPVQRAARPRHHARDDGARRNRRAERQGLLRLVEEETSTK